MTKQCKSSVSGVVRSILSALGLCLAVASGAQAQVPPASASQAPVGVPQAPPSGPEGVWIDHTGRGAVEIVPCGANLTSLCGNIVWLKDPNDKKGKPLRDELNEDKRQRTRPICGLPVIGGLKRQRDGSWDEGWIYDPEKGESFDVELRMLRPDVLQVKGYKGLKFLNETFQWKRASSAPFQRCAAT